MRVVVCRLGTSRGDAWSEHRVKGGFKRLHAPGGAVSMETTMFKIKVTAETDVVIGVRKRVVVRCEWVCVGGGGVNADTRRRNMGDSLVAPTRQTLLLCARSMKEGYPMGDVECLWC